MPDGRDKRIAELEESCAEWVNARDRLHAMTVEQSARIADLEGYQCPKCGQYLRDTEKQGWADGP